MMFARSFALVTVLEICGCAPPAIAPGPPRDVAKSAADAWSAAGHACEMKGDLAYCDMSAAGLPLIIGYAAGRRLLFGTVFDTESLGKPCAEVPFDRVMRPEWMTVKCDAIALADGTPKTVLSIVGGGVLGERGMSRDDLVRAASLFLQEAEGFLIRLKDFLPLAR